MHPIPLLTSSPHALPDYTQHPALIPTGSPPAAGLYLAAEEQGIVLRRVGSKGAVWVDFVGGAAQHRRLHGGGELLAKAVGRSSQPAVWDATGGLGRDSFVLAGLGLHVHIFEQHPAVYCLLADGLARARACPDTAPIAERLTLHHADAATHMPRLAAQTGRPQVVYLDPMYPERRKSAAVKKEMAFFHELVGTAQNDASLFDTARTVAAARVVVKRPRLGEFLCGRQPDYQYTGKSTRFDVYLPLSPSLVEAT
ncbi:class I SAM-dependent methyltransferase [Eikenella sp. S3360]|uniref:Ribosomal RNA small subunit methyltransferase J n=1 Tax=Eikenella glucosivorans TaxID=2766967 RepID=A0ABS0N8K2_9NEIS|nr:class I SAM-dependent methyltransferase [Eikenella glucosivorans]MBH5328658.1 class I SAM-dependent methyltransferase [Eikenella glucosivorans]